MSEDRILTFTDDDFDDRIGQFEGPILVDFWANWCAPCKAVVPHLRALAEEYAGAAHVAQVDIDHNGDLTNRFGIRSIPTLIVFKSGKVVDQLIGAAPLAQIRKMLAAHLED